MARLAVIVATLFISACQSTGALAPMRRQVVLGAHSEIVVTSDRRVAGACHALGSDRVWVIGPNLERNALSSMRRSAARRGGNLVISDGPASFIAGGAKASAAGSSVTISGDIYLC